MDFFPKNVKRLRKNQGLTQADAAQILCFSRPAWSEYELGTSKPRFDDLMRIVEYFDISLTELVEIDLANVNPNDILELREILKKVKANVKASVKPNEKTKIEIARGSPADQSAIEQIGRMESELAALRKKLGL